MNFIKICIGILVYMNLGCSCLKNIPLGEKISPRVNLLEIFKKNLGSIKNTGKMDIGEQERGMDIKHHNAISYEKIDPRRGSGFSSYPKRSKRDAQPDGQLDGYYRGPWANAYQRPSVHQFMLANKPIHYATRDPEHVRFHTIDEAPAVPKGLPTADQEFLRLHYESRNEQLPVFKPPTKLTPGSLASFDGDTKKPGPHYSFERKFMDDVENA